MYYAGYRGDVWNFHERQQSANLAKLIILWGHNPAETKFDSGTMYYLRKAKALGIPIIVIDPRKNDTVLQLGTEWIPIRPATDSALADAMAYVIPCRIRNSLTGAALDLTAHICRKELMLRSAVYLI